MQELGYATYDNKMMDTNEPGKDGEQVKGYYSDQTHDAYINDRYNSSTTDLLTTAGHEMSHLIDNKQNLATDEAYADIMGSALANYTDFALYYTDQGSLATTNTHNTGQVTSYPSIFNDNTYATNNAEFAALDKKKGDNSLIGDIIKIGGKFLIKAFSKTAEKGGKIKKPNDIPDDWIESTSKTGGKKWQDPKNPQANETRIEPGGKNQENPQPYRKDRRNGQYQDKNGNTVSKKSPEAHQPWEL
ncbi:hypothetical protein KKA17_07090 [bacterium]|nr:hypothetical protein [bacterium]